MHGASFAASNIVWLCNFLFCFVLLMEQVGASMELEQVLKSALFSLVERIKEKKQEINK